MQSFQIKRIQQEIKDLQRNPSELFYAEPSDENIKIWHFTFRGPEESDYEGGIYHGTIELDEDYPMKPPNIFFMNASGRFEINTKICLNITKFHQENWDPSINIRTMIEAIINFFPIDDNSGSIGSITASSSQRKHFAQLSKEYQCQQCGSIVHLVHKIKANKSTTQSHYQSDHQQNQQTDHQQECQQNPDDQQNQNTDHQQQQNTDHQQQQIISDELGKQQQDNLDQNEVQKTINLDQQQDQFFQFCQQNIKLDDQPTQPQPQPQQKVKDNTIIIHDILFWVINVLIIYVIVYY